MSTLLLISILPGEVRAARIEHGEAVDYRIEREARPSRVGDFHLGRVRRLLPALAAALVDIGDPEPAFLSLDDARNIGRLHEGQSLLVQVKRDAQAGKALGLTTRLPACEAACAALRAAAARASPPALLSGGAGALERILGDAGGAAAIRIDDPAALAPARAFLSRHLPPPLPAIALHRGGEIFEDHGIAATLDGAALREVALEGGGRLVIDRTEAMTAVDVDSGAEPGRSAARRAALETNLRAAAAIARQIRLRNLGGAIIIDFVGMRSPRDRDAVLAALAEALAADPVATRLHGWTRLGHAELTRHRQRPALDDILYERGPDGFLRETAMTVALACLRAAARAAAAQSPPGAGPVTLRAAPAIAGTLAGDARPYLDALATRLQRRLEVVPDPALARGSFAVEPR